MVKKSIISIIIVIGIIAVVSIFFGSVNNEFSSISIGEKEHVKDKIFGFEKGHGFFKESIHGSVEDDLSEYVNGKQSLKITTDGNGEEVIIKKYNMQPAINFSEKFRLE